MNNIIVTFSRLIKYINNMILHIIINYYTKKINLCIIYKSYTQNLKLIIIERKQLKTVYSLRILNSKF